MSSRSGGPPRPGEMRDSPEFDRIRSLIQAVAAPSTPEVELGPGDDAAILDVADSELVVVSADLSVEDVHFRREWLTWDSIGFRAVAAALSDLAAMAARPIGVLVSLAIPPELDDGTLAEMVGGVGECLREHGASLLGGDLSRSSGPVVFDVTVIGAAVDPVRRSGALPGDELWISGRLGGAACWVPRLPWSTRQRWRPPSLGFTRCSSCAAARSCYWRRWPARCCLLVW